MKGYYQLVIAMLKQHGYIFLRTGKGSHELWSNGIRHQTVSTNMPARDMANLIMKQARINHKF